MPRKVTINYKKTQKVIKVDEMSDWEDAAEFLISKMKPGMVIALHGDLGAGKTTLTQYIAKQLGVSRRALSPTFALIRNYVVKRQRSEASAKECRTSSLLSRKEGSNVERPSYAEATAGRRGTLDVGRLVHVDAYRIEDERELLALDLDEELMEPGTVMIIEWPERVEEWVKKQKELIRVEIEIQ